MRANNFHIVDTHTGAKIEDGIKNRKIARIVKRTYEYRHEEANGFRPVKPRYHVFMNGSYIH